MRKKFRILVYTFILILLGSGITNAELTLNDIFKGETPTITDYQKLFTEYYTNRGYSEPDVTVCQATDGNFGIISPTVEDYDFYEATAYHLYVSPYSLDQLEAGDSTIDTNNIFVKEVRPIEGTTSVEFNLSDLALDPNQVYYTFIFPISTYDEIGVPSEVSCLLQSSNMCLAGDSGCRALKNLNNTCENGMTSANVTHRTNNNTITLQRDSLGDCNVNIKIFDPVEESYVNVAIVPMSDGQYTYKTKRVGEHIFTLGNNKNEVVYKVTTSSENINSEQKIVLKPGLNVVSTPAILSDFSFSNGGNGISFSKLSNGKWVNITPTTQNFTPLEGFLVRNSTNSDITLSLIYDVAQADDILLSKNLDAGWNLLGVTHAYNPFDSIANATATLFVDFTKQLSTNAIANSYSISQQLQSTNLGKAYGIFVNKPNGTYGGVNNQKLIGNYYSEEFQSAYKRAFENGFTTMATIDNAGMYNNITRAQMAKLLANYAKNLMNRTPDESAACYFSDTASVQGDLATAIVEACQLGIMGVGNKNFRPYDLVTRAEFGTALSTLLWGNEYAGGSPDYANHLNALKSAGIISDINNPTTTEEIKGYVLIMLQRASTYYKDAHKSSSLNNTITGPIELKEDIPSTIFEGTYSTQQYGTNLQGISFILDKFSNGEQLIADRDTNDITFYLYIDNEEIGDCNIDLNNHLSTSGAIACDIDAKEGEYIMQTNAGGSHNIKIEAKLDGDFIGSTYAGHFEFNGNYTDSNVSSANIMSNIVPMYAPKRSFTLNNHISGSVQLKNGDKEVVFDGTYSTEGYGAKIRGASFVLNKFMSGEQIIADGDTNNITFHLYIENHPIGYCGIDLNNHLSTSGAISCDIDAFEGRYLIESNTNDFNNIKIEAELDGGFTGSTYAGYFEFAGNFTNPSQSSATVSNNFTIEVLDKPLQITPLNQSQVLLSKDIVTLAELKIGATNSQTLSSIQFSLSGAISSADDIEVTVDNRKVTVDEINNSPEGLIYLIDETIPPGGYLIITVKSKKEIVGDVELKIVEINGEPEDIAFTKKYEKALVSIDDEESGDGFDRFHLKIERSDSIIVSNVKMYAGETEIDYHAYPETDNSITILAQYYEYTNLENKFIDKISYDYYSSTGSGNTRNVSILKSEYDKFFRNERDFYYQIFN